MPQKKKKKKGKKLLSAVKIKEKKWMFCEIDLHWKILPKCQLGVDERM